MENEILQRKSLALPFSKYSRKVGVKLGYLERFFHLEKSGFVWIWFVSYTQSENIYLVKNKNEKNYL